MANTVIYNKQTEVYTNSTLVKYPPYYSAYSSSSKVAMGTITVNRTPRVTPGYTNLRRLKVRIKPLNYFISEVFDGHSIGQLTYIYQGNPKYIAMTITGQITQPSIVLEPEIESSASVVARVQAQANLALLLKIKDMKVNVLQAFSERKQVFSLIMSTASLLANVMINLRRGNLVMAADYLGLRVSKRAATRYRRAYNIKPEDKDHVEQVSANGWLAIQYGVRPLLQDIIGAAELYAQKEAGEVITRQTVQKQGSLAHVSSGSGSGSQGRVSRIRTRTGDVLVKVSCDFSTGSEKTHTLAQMGISNSFLVAYELLPWSFVVDWFIPIGNWLSAMDATKGLTFQSGFMSTKITWYSSETQTFSDQGAYDVFGRSGTSTAHSYERTFTRTILSAFPSVPLPRFKNPLSLEHAANAVALLVSLRNWRKK